MNGGRAPLAKLSRAFAQRRIRSNAVLATGGASLHQPDPHMILRTLLAGLAGLCLTTTAAAETAELTVTFKGMTAHQGAILFVLSDSEASYDNKAPPRASGMAPVRGAEASQTLTGLAPGRYAIKAFHDVDGDGKMGTNPFGMPTEPFAFSNDAPAVMGPAPWAAAAFEVKAGRNVHQITID